MGCLFYKVAMTIGGILSTTLNFYREDYVNSVNTKYKRIIEDTSTKDEKLVMVGNCS